MFLQGMRWIAAVGVTIDPINYCRLTMAIDALMPTLFVLMDLRASNWENGSFLIWISSLVH
jgi:hypothetical protein